MRHSIISCVVMLLTVLGVAACSAETQGPTTWLDHPLDGDQVPLQRLTIQAHASDADGVARFEFFVSEVPLVTVSGNGKRLADAQVEWVPPMPGTYLVRARAVDNNGNIGSEASSHIVVGGALTPTPVPATAPPPTITPALTATNTPTPIPTPTIVPPHTPTPTSTITNTPTRTPIATATTAPPVCPGPPVIPSFTANPSTISTGQSSTLSWGAVSNATSVVIEPGIGGVGTPGSTTVKPATTTIYTLTATGCGGTVKQQVTITVFGPIFTVPASDTTPPTIANAGSDRSEINQQGQYCTATQRATVSATVTDAGGVNRVVARYSGPASGEVVMSPIGGNVYRGTIGPIANIGNLSIRVVAWDKAGNVAQSSPFVVRVVVCIY